MNPQQLQALPTPQLKRRYGRHRFALWVVAIGAAIAITAAVYRGSTAAFPVSTLVMALLALAAATPVFLEERRMRRELADRR